MTRPVGAPVPDPEPSDAERRLADIEKIIELGVYFPFVDPVASCLTGHTVGCTCARCGRLRSGVSAISAPYPSPVPDQGEVMNKQRLTETIEAERRDHPLMSFGRYAKCGCGVEFGPGPELYVPQHQEHREERIVTAVIRAVITDLTDSLPSALPPSGPPTAITAR